VTRGVPVNWSVLFAQMALALVVTIPAAALAAAEVFAITQLASHLLAGTALAILGLGLAVALWIGPQRTARSRHFEPDQLTADRSAAMVS
jgi:hypothetical protein